MILQLDWSGANKYKPIISSLKTNKSFHKFATTTSGPQNKLGLKSGLQNKLGLKRGPQNKLGLKSGYRGFQKMKENARYVKIIEWSFEDHCFVGSAPGLFYGGCHGSDEKQVFSE